VHVKKAVMIFGPEVEKVAGAGKFVALHTVKVRRGAEMQPVTLRLDGFGGQSHASAKSDPKEGATGTHQTASCQDPGPVWTF